MGEEYQNGNRPVFSRNEAVRYALLLVAVVTFAITLKVNQDADRKRQDATDLRIEALTGEIAALRADRYRDMTEVRADIEEWKRATAGLFFKRQGR